MKCTPLTLCALICAADALLYPLPHPTHVYKHQHIRTTTRNRAVTMKIAREDAQRSIKEFQCITPRAHTHRGARRVALIDVSAVLSEYTDILELQNECVDALLGDGGAHTLIIAQHTSTVTLGSATDHTHVRTLEPTTPTRVLRVDRGGEATWHGPGQVVVYPILDLNDFRTDVHWYIRALEEVAIRASTHVVCNAYLHQACGDSGARAAATHEERVDVVRDGLGLVFGRVAGYSGCWGGVNVGTPPTAHEEDIDMKAQEHTREEKVAAVGVKFRRWVTKHGVALNVNCDLSWAEVGGEGGGVRIVPCGIFDRGVASLASLTGMHIAVGDAVGPLVLAFEEVFGCEVLQQQKQAAQWR